MARILKLTIEIAVIGAIALLLNLGSGLLISPPAAALIREHEEAPGQILYKSLWSLRDQHQHPWQAIAFKQVYPDRVNDVYLRLVGFPDAVTLDHSQPLTLTNSMGQQFTLTDESASLFPDNLSPAPNVAQYRLQPLLPELRSEIPLTLTMMQIDGETVQLSVPPWLVQEWSQLLLK